MNEDLLEDMKKRAEEIGMIIADTSGTNQSHVLRSTKNFPGYGDERWTLRFELSDDVDVRKVFDIIEAEERRKGIRTD